MNKLSVDTAIREFLDESEYDTYEELIDGIEHKLMEVQQLESESRLDAAERKRNEVRQLQEVKVQLDGVLAAANTTGKFESETSTIDVQNAIMTYFRSIKRDEFDTLADLLSAIQKLEQSASALRAKGKIKPALNKEAECAELVSIKTDLERKISERQKWSQESAQQQGGSISLIHLFETEEFDSYDDLTHNIADLQVEIDRLVEKKSFDGAQRLQHRLQELLHLQKRADDLLGTVHSSCADSVKVNTFVTEMLTDSSLEVSSFDVLLSPPSPPPTDDSYDYVILGDTPPPMPVVDSPAMKSCLLPLQDNVQFDFDTTSVDEVIKQLAKHCKLQREGKSLYTVDELRGLLDLLTTLVEKHCLDTAHVIATIDELRNNVGTRTFQLQALATLARLLLAVQPMDIKLMVSLISQAERACLEIEGKDIILMLGPTGAGKSTTIHFLANSELIKETVNGRRQITVKHASSELAKVLTGASTRSITRSIKAVEVTRSDGEVVTLCDSPGFYDTDGPEIDIANGIGLIKALLKCRSVKPVVVLSHMNLGNRMEGVRALSKTLSAMLHSLPRVLDAFEYIFTRFDNKEDEPHLFMQFQMMLDDLADDHSLSDPSLIQLVEDLKNKTSKGCTILMPLEDSRDNLLLKLCSGSVITNPAEQFKTFATADSANLFSGQLSILRQKAQTAIARRRFELLRQTLDELKALTFLDFRECDIVFDETIEMTKSLILNLKNEVSEHWDLAIHCNGSDKSNTRRFIERAVSALKSLLDLDSIGKLHLQETFSHLEAEVYHWLSSCYEQLSIQFPLKKSQFDFSLLREDVACKMHMLMLLITVCRNLLLTNHHDDALVTIIGDMDRIYRDCHFEVQSQLFNLKGGVEVELQSCNLDVLANYLDYALQSVSIFTAIFGDEITRLFDELLHTTQQYFNHCLNNACCILSSSQVNTVFSKVELANLGNFSNLLISAKSSDRLQYHLNKAFVAKLDDQVNIAAKDFIEIGFNSIKEAEREHRANRPLKVLRPLSEWITKLTQLSNIPLFQIYQETLFKARDSARDLIRTIISDFRRTWVPLRNIKVYQTSDGVVNLEKQIRIMKNTLPFLSVIFGNNKDESIRKEFSEAINDLVVFVNGCQENMPSVEQLTMSLDSSILKKLNDNSVLIFALQPQFESGTKLGERIESFLRLARNTLLEALKYAQRSFAEVSSGSLTSACRGDLDVLWGCAQFVDACVNLNVHTWSLIDFIEPRERIYNSVKSLFAQFEDYLSDGMLRVDEQLSRIFTTEDSSTEEEVSSKIASQLSECQVCLQFIEEIMQYSNSRTLTGNDHIICLRVLVFRELPRELKTRWSKPDSKLSIVLLRIQQYFDESSRTYVSQSCIEQVVEVCTMCRPFDKLITAASTDARSSSDISFDSLFHIGHALLAKMKDSSETELLLALTKKDYAAAKLAADRMILFAERDPYLKDKVGKCVEKHLQSIKSALNNALKPLVPARDQFKQDSVVTVLEAIRDLEGLVENLKIYVLIPEESSILIKDARKRLNAFISAKCDLCKVHLKSKEYAACVKLLRHTAQLCDSIRISNVTFGNDGEKDDLCNHLESVLASVEASIMAQIQAQMDAIADGAIENYHSLEPEKLYRELQQCQEPRFDELAKVLESSLISRMTSTILTAKENIGDIDHHEACIKLITESFPHVPTSVFAQVSPLVESLRQQVEQVKEEIRRDSAGVADDQKWKLFQSRLFHQFSEGGHHRMKHYKLELQKVAEKETSALLGDLSRNDVTQFIKKGPGIIDGYCHHLAIIKTHPINRGVVTYWYHDWDYFMADKIIESSRQKLLNGFKNILLKFFAQLDDLPSRVAQSGVYDFAVKAVEYLLGLCHACHQFPAFRDSLAILLDYAQKIAAGFKSLIAFITSIRDHVDTAIRSKNLLEIKKWMDIVQHSGVFHQVLKAYQTDFEELSSIGGAFRIPDEFVSCVIDFFSYDNFKGLVGHKLIEIRNSAREKYVWHPRTDTPNAADRDEFYSENYFNFTVLRDCALIHGHVDLAIFNVGQVVHDHFTHIDQELESFYHELSTRLGQFPTDNVIDYEIFNKFYDNLRSFHEKFLDRVLSNKAKALMDKIAREFHGFLGLQRNVITATQHDLVALADVMITLKTISVSIYPFQEKINATLDTCLMQFAQINPANIGSLGLILSQNENLIAKMLLEHKAFEHYQILLRNKNTLTFNIDDVLGTKPNVKESERNNYLRSGNGDDDIIDIHELRSLYQSFDDLYWQMVLDGSRKVNTADTSSYLVTMVNGARMTAAQQQQDKDSKTESALRILAHIFAYWTLAKHYSTGGASTAEEVRQQGDQSCSSSTAAAAAVEEDNTTIASESSSSSLKNEFLQPHAAQIIAIFRLTGIDRNQLNNHLAQIKTGEGKSVTLAVTAVYFALLGYDVDCACYSQYLSDRDYTDFVPLFNAFNVNRHIRYGTFNIICEQFINRHVNIRLFVEGIIANDNVKMKASRHTTTDTALLNHDRRSILLIDEVDVFLSQDFYGNRYRPLAQLKHPTIIAFMDYIWKNRNDRSKIRFSVVKQCDELKAIFTVFPIDWQPLLLECVKLMLLDLHNFESDYLVVNQRIAYKEQDGISFTAFYGFKTIFAYYKEVDSRQIARAILEERICFPLDCGSFAYAEIPKMYTYTLGVTGTLETLTKFELDLLQRVYNLHHMTFIPSVYGANKLTFRGKSEQDVKIERDAGYFIAIRDEIRTRLVGINSNHDNTRAVLVFFESIPKLNAFYNSPEWSPYKARTRTLTEDVSTKDKEGIIRQAVTSGSVTLLTSAFGRGTDFICYDDKLLRDGGVHVIQTFVSQSISEETQIMGRTARQGNNGSYSMILLEQDLEPFSITAETVETMRKTGELYTTIANHRETRFAMMLPDNLKFVEEIRAEHVEANDFKSVILMLSSAQSQQPDTAAVLRPTGDELTKCRSLLMKFNAAPPMMIFDGEPSRTICLMDATGSMSGLLEKVKRTVKIMFERAYAIVQEEHVDNSFEMQFAVYRNYSSGPGLLLQYSPWASRPIDLEQFINSISASGGEGNEAVEIGLWHVMEEHALKNVSQVILIGDYPPNTCDEVISKRRSPSSWIKTRFTQPTYYERELTRIAQEKIPVHAFYVKPYAQAAFERIAATTGGKTGPLDIDSLAGAEMLTDIVTKQILENLGGGGEGGKRLVDAYNVKFGKGRGHVSSQHL